MEVYFAPLAGSLATRIALTEAGIEANYIQVDTDSKRTFDGQDFLAVNPLGLVPAVRTSESVVIAENVAILNYVGERAPELLPRSDDGLVELRQWLSFIATELHAGLFACMFDDEANDAVRTYARKRAKTRLQALDSHLSQREFLLDRFTVADAYLITVLHWAQATPVDLDAWPNLSRYLAKGLERPSVKASIEIELPLYLEERKRQSPAGG